MARIYLLLLAAVVFMASCSNEFNDEYLSNGELTLNQKASGAISSKGEVDWYHYRAVEVNRVLQVKITSETVRPDVDLLATVYQPDDQGNKVRLYAAHERENSVSPVDMTLNIFIDEPKDLYIAVRDLMDDDYSENKYYVSVRFEDEPDGNDSFSKSTQIAVNDESACQVDSIGHIGDVDVFGFTAASDGIYQIQTEFSPFPGTDVELTVNLYDSDGSLVNSLASAQSFTYDMRSSLTSGDYYVLIDDFGKNDFDLSSTYRICVNTVASDEVNGNDSQSSAAAVADPSLINGSLDYSEDQDWYMFSLPAKGASGFQVINLRFDDTSDQNTNYLVDIIDSGGITLFSHNFNGGSKTYESQIKAGSGSTHYLVVRPSHGEVITESYPYTASIEVVNVDDAAESAGGNDTINTAIELTPASDQAGAIEGKVSFRGDEDWYFLTIADTTKPQILELFFESESASAVDYEISIMRDGLEKKLFDADGSDGQTKLNTSLFVPVINSSGVVYSFKIADYQGDNGADVSYKLRVNLVDIPETVPNGEYYSEATEADNATETVKLVYNALINKEFAVNSSILDFKSPGPGVTITENLPTEGLTTISFPWITGYIDFQSDQDWFMMPNTPLDDSNSKWYYDIRIELASNTPGSDVEYVWRLYPDRNHNKTVMERESGSDGFMASAGDTSTDVGPLGITVPEEGTDQEFWVGDRWAGDVYLSISDFNFTGLSEPDDDWGYDAPYSLRVTLVYHTGKSDPDE